MFAVEPFWLSDTVLDDLMALESIRLSEELRRLRPAAVADRSTDGSGIPPGGTRPAAAAATSVHVAGPLFTGLRSLLSVAGAARQRAVGPSQIAAAANVAKRLREKFITRQAASRASRASRAPEEDEAETRRPSVDTSALAARRSSAPAAAIEPMVTPAVGQSALSQFFGRHTERPPMTFFHNVTETQSGALDSCHSQANVSVASETSDAGIGHYGATSSVPSPVHRVPSKSQSNPFQHTAIASMQHQQRGSDLKKRISGVLGLSAASSAGTHGGNVAVADGSKHFEGLATYKSNSNFNRSPGFVSDSRPSQQATAAHAGNPIVIVVHDAGTPRSIADNLPLQSGHEAPETPVGAAGFLGRTFFGRR